jgi:YegS/Rv2252/BmrU family lipid kinase
MASKKQARAKLTQVLKRARSEHRRVAKKVETTQAKLEKRTRKLRTLETNIAKLERRASLAEAAQSSQAPEEDKNLRPVPLIYNPKSGTNVKDAHPLEKIVRTLRSHGIRAEVGIKTSGKAARKIAKKAADQKQALVIVAGGDGTIEDVASELVSTQTALGILPIGTMNNVARSLGIPLDLDDACALLGAGSTRQIDVGCVITDEKSPGEYFLETAGLGLTALAFPAGQSVKKGRLGTLPRALVRLFEYKPGPVEIELDDGETIHANSELVTVSNAPLTGLNFLIAPEAKMDDGLLDIAVYDGMGKTDLLDYFRAMSDGKRAENPKVRFHRAHKVRIRSQQLAPAVSDKDAIPAEKVMDIELIPQALMMVVGKGSGLSLPVDAVQSVPPLSGPQPQTPNGNGGAKPEQQPETTKPEQQPEAAMPVDRDSSSSE